MEAIEGVTQVDVDLELDETFVDEVTSSSTITGSEKENIGSTKFKMSPASTPNQPTSNPDDTFGNKK